MTIALNWMTWRAGGLGLAAVALSAVGSASLAETYHCPLKAQSVRARAFVPEWIEIERTHGLAGVVVRDAYMVAHGIQPFAAEISRENGKVLSITWTSYSVNSGYVKAPVKPRFALSLFKANNTIRMNHVAQRGGTDIGASGRCVLKE
jgi:hypothetical protein